MNIKTNLQRVWSALAFLSLFLTAYLWFSQSDSTALLNTSLVLDALMFLIALPCSVFGAGVIFAAWYVLDLNPIAAEGVYLNTVVLAILGTVQWFWLIRFYAPPEVPFQKLNLT